MPPGTVGAVPFTNNADVLLVGGGAVWLTHAIAFRPVVLGPRSRRSGSPQHLARVFLAT